jgi:hypothetical protein
MRKLPLFLLIFSECSIIGQGNKELSQFSKWDKEINDNIDSYDKYELFTRPNNGLYVLIPYAQEIGLTGEPGETFCLYKNDTLRVDPDYQITFYFEGKNLKLIKSYYSDSPEASEDRFEYFYVHNNELFYYSFKSTKTDWWAENCCPKETVEYEYFFKNKKIVSGTGMNQKKDEQDIISTFDSYTDVEILK